MIVLDTHAWIWRANSSPSLSAVARDACDHAGRLIVPAISVWEVAMLVSKGRLGLDRDIVEWVKRALAFPRISLEGLSPEISILSSRLPGDLHGDPADRLIAATALHLGAPLVTKDTALRRWGQIETIW